MLWQELVLSVTYDINLLSTRGATPAVPSTAGTLGEVTWPDMEGVRVDTWVETGSEVTPYYDSLLAKLMVFAPDRPAAIQKLQQALAATQVGTYVGAACANPVRFSDMAVQVYETRRTACFSADVVLAWAASCRWQPQQQSAAECTVPREPATHWVTAAEKDANSLTPWPCSVHLNLTACISSLLPTAAEWHPQQPGAVQDHRSQPGFCRWRHHDELSRGLSLCAARGGGRVPRHEHYRAGVFSLA